MADQTSLRLVHTMLAGYEDSTSLVRVLLYLVLAMLVVSSQLTLASTSSWWEAIETTMLKIAN
jgi:hypothetical protein